MRNSKFIRSRGAAARRNAAENSSHVPLMDDLFGDCAARWMAPPSIAYPQPSSEREATMEESSCSRPEAEGSPSGLPAVVGDDDQSSDCASNAIGEVAAANATEQARDRFETFPSSIEPSPSEEPTDSDRAAALVDDARIPSADSVHLVPNATPLFLFDDPQPVEPVCRGHKRSWMEGLPPISSMVMEEVEHLSALIASAKAGDRDPLTKAVTIQRIDDLSLARIASRGADWVEQRLREGLPHRHTGELRAIKKPESAARRIFYALGRLKASHPDDRMLPDIHVEKKAPKLSAMPLDAEPENFKADLQQWGVISRQERGRETGEGRALDDATRHTYVEKVRLMGGAAKQLGLVNDSFGVGSLASIDIAEKVFDYLDRLYTPAIVATMVAALARVSIDLFGHDPAHEADIDYLQAESKDRFPDQALSENARKRYDELVSDPLKMLTIRDAPAAMMARAHEPSLRPADRVGRAARAVVTQLKLESPALGTTQAAELDADVHLRRERSVLFLRLPNPRERDGFRWDPCTPAAEALLTEWLELKDEHGIAGSLLFPSDKDPAKPQIARVAMAGLYVEFELVTNEHLTFDEIKTLRCYKAIKAHPEKLRHIAEAAGYKDPRSLARRLGILITRRKGRKAA